MNQILYMNNNKKKSGTLEIKKVLKIFAIASILFGMMLIAKGSYALINQKEESKSIPVVEILQENDYLILNVKHDKLIDKIIYKWNEKEETTLQGKGRNQITEKIKVPTGINILDLKVVDINGQTVNYTKEYELKEGDITKPEIEFAPEDSKIKVAVRDETEMDYMQYYWNNEDATTVKAKESSPKLIEERITVLKGENTLHVIGVDKAGNKSVQEQVCKGATKPTINLTLDGNILKILVKDEEEIQKIDYVLNDVYYSTDAMKTGESLKMKEIEIPQELTSGNNKITVKAYNTNGFKTEVSAEPTI